MKLRHAVVYYLRGGQFVGDDDCQHASHVTVINEGLLGYFLVEAQIPRYRPGRNTVVMVGGVWATRGRPQESARRDLVSRRFAEQYPPPTRSSRLHHDPSIEIGS
jgi:hypothetical protein